MTSHKVVFIDLVSSVDGTDDIVDVRDINCGLVLDWFIARSDQSFTDYKEEHLTEDGPLGYLGPGVAFPITLL